SIKPDWWENRYGPRPYKFNNPFLWEDMRSGYIADGEYKGYYPEYARPNAPIPADGSGKLFNPVDLNLVDAPAQRDARANWKVGDCSPVETVFRRSEFWAFAMAQVGYLMKPA